MKSLRPARVCARAIQGTSTRIRAVSTLKATASLFSEPSIPTDFGAHKRTRQAVPVPEREAARSPALLALHARLGLSTDVTSQRYVPYSTLAQTLITASAGSSYADNLGMASFGKNMLSFYVHEHFMFKYPRLPPSVLSHVVNLHVSEVALARVAKATGVEHDTRSALMRYLSQDSAAPALGHLAYTPKETAVEAEAGVIKVDDNELTQTPSQAEASFIRSVVAAVYAHSGLAAARDFIYAQIIRPHHVDLASLLAFEQPTRELAVLCAREQLEPPVARLMVETGRYSAAPVFVVGVFSGTMKLGEGQGSSMAEARTRAAVHALKAWYLYSPKGDQVYVDEGVVVR